MSVTGKNSLSFRKNDVREQKNLAIGFKKTMFAHKATAGDTGIDLSALVAPPEMTGFLNPTSGELLASQLFFYRKNLTLISSLRGVLMDYLSYNVATSSRIDFVGFTAAAGEIFTGVIDYNARNGIQVVDAAPLVASGTLAVGVTDFNVGQVFEVNKYSSQQAGAVIVYRNGVQQFRNSNNSSVTLDGNYYEVNNGSGLGSIIRFNNAPVSLEDNILVISNGLLVYNPDGSALQAIESLAGQIDAMVPTLADLAGVPETDFQAAPNNVDLKSFGDQVFNHEQRIDALEAIVDAEIYLNAGNGHGSTNTRIRRFSNVQRNTGGLYMTYADDATFGATITINIAGMYAIQYSDSAGGTADRFGVSVNTSALGTNISSLTYAQGKRAVCTAQAGPRETQLAFTMRFSPGDIIRAHTDGTMSLTTESCIFQIVRIGN